MWAIGGAFTLVVVAFAAVAGVMWRKLEKVDDRVGEHHNQLAVLEPVREMILDAGREKLRKTFGRRGAAK
jgi:hypothetical protein